MKTKQILRRTFCVASIALLAIEQVAAEVVSLPSNTQIYVETDQPVSGKKKHTQEGQIVRSTIWRDVEVDGRVVIKAGTPVLVRVDSLKGAKIAGIKGKMSLGAYDTNAVDGTRIALGGGYYKEGKGRIALTATLAAVVFIPLIFIKGKSADLPRGTIFDAYTKQNMEIDISGQKAPGRKIDLSSSVGTRLSVEVLYDELESAEKPENFAFLINGPEAWSGDFIIDKVNGAEVDPITLDVGTPEVADGKAVWRAEVGIKRLSKEFKKGINTFEIASEIGGERFSEEVVLDIQF